MTFSPGSLVEFRGVGDDQPTICVVIGSRPAKRFMDLGPIEYEVFDALGRSWVFQKCHIDSGKVKEVVP